MNFEFIVQKIFRKPAVSKVVLFKNTSLYKQEKWKSYIGNLYRVFQEDSVIMITDINFLANQQRCAVCLCFKLFDTWTWQSVRK